LIDDIVFEAKYPYPPDVVWRVIASPEGLNAWLMQNNFVQAEVGHQFRFMDRPRPFWDGICDCEVADAERSRRFVLRWGINGKEEPSLVSWTLTPTGDGGTRVQFRHGGLRGVMGWIMKKGMSKGWRRMMERSIPFVLKSVASKGQMPSREDVAAALKGK
jgi:uncharacterized protein YndB with AHSA1/START domain